MSGVEIRKVDTEVHETGVGQTARTDTNYELGAEIDGAWIRFASVGSNVVDAAKARAEAERAANPPQEATPSTAPSSEPTMADVAPTPPQQAAAAQGNETQTV